MLDSHPQPNCLVCGTSGKPAYQNVTDVLFGVPGMWNIDQCTSSACGTLWLNPYPRGEIIPSFYAGYHTHDNAELVRDRVELITFMDKVRNGFLYTALKYGTPSSSNWFFNLISYLHPGWRDARASNYFYTPKKDGGLFLDIGCGSGGSMASMKDRGWRVYGIDFDEKALEVAHNRGLSCAVGGLLEQNFPSDHFDAILLSHVIEHLPNAENILKECFRILKPGGTLSLITPNAGSWSRKIFGKNWRGLEVPRHLQIFTPSSLKNLARKSPFSNIRTFSSPHGEMFFIKESRKLALQGKTPSSIERKLLSSRLVDHTLLFLFGWLMILLPHKFGMAVAVCTK